LVRETYSS
jgi:hypothetical protein